MPKQKVETQASVSEGQCACGRVRIEIDVPARWAWHDHSRAGRLAHGGAYVTYVGSWRSRFRVLAGDEFISRFENKGTGTTRSFCTVCGTPLIYERAASPQMVNLPRGLFARRTGREARYHLHLEETPEWAYRGERLVPLKGYPGVMWNRGKRPLPTSAL